MGKEKDNIFVGICDREKGTLQFCVVERVRKMCVCVCVCVRERERERRKVLT